MFEITSKLANLTAPSQTKEVRLLVGGDATLTLIPRTILEGIGVKAVSTLPFSMSDGREVEREKSSVLLIIRGRSAPVTVVFGEVGEKPVLGLTALLGLGLILDRTARKLIPCDLRRGTLRFVR